MTSPPKSDTKSLFADFGVRLVGVVIDFIVVMFLAQFVNDQVLDAVGLAVSDNRLVFHPVMFVYFSAFWWSPMRATPVQFLLGMRVVDEASQRLSLGRAALRSVLLVGLIVAIMTLIANPSNIYFAAIALMSYALLFLAAIMPNRQAAHDLVAHSLVVNRVALKSPEHQRHLRELVLDDDPESCKRRRPSVMSIVGNVLVLGVPAVVLLSFAMVHNDMNLRYRTSYAVQEVAGLKIALEEYYAAYSRWPTDDSELGVATTANYPDGGYYELEESGVIRIRFTVKPELMEGSIIVSPKLEEDGITWECHSDGGIAQTHLAAACRD